MKKLISCLFLILIANGFSQTPANPPSDQSTAEITKLRNGLTESFKSGDIDRLLTYLDPNVVVTWQNGEVCRGREEVKAFYDRMMTGDKRVVREITSTPEVIGRHVYGDWAVSWGNLHEHFVLTDGSDLPFNSVFTATIAKRGDNWLVTAFHASVNAFDNPVLKLGIRKTTLYVGLAAGAAGLIVGLAAALLLRRRNGRSA
ncbi:MAG: YybH family protein [Chthoniobacterales bacterium]